MRTAANRRMRPEDDEESLDIYLREIKGTGLLSREEEREIARRARSGDEDARRHLAEANTAFVIFFAKRFQGQGLPLSDLVQEGNVGLMRAVDKFDERRGIKFISYAMFWIRQAMQQAIRKQAHPLCLPTDSDELRRKIRTGRERLGQRLGRDPTTEELAVELRIDVTRIQKIIMSTKQPLSLEMPVGDMPLGDTIRSLDERDGDEGIIENDLRQCLERALSCLDPRERKAIRLRFGLEDGIFYEREDIGERLGISRQWAREVEKRAFKKLRKVITELHGDDALEKLL